MEYDVVKEMFGEYTVRVVADGDYSLENPRDWDNLGTFYTQDLRCLSPDKYDERRRDIHDQIASDLGVDTFEYWGDMSDQERGSAMRKFEAAAIMLPVYKYEHSGVAYRTEPFSCPWDSGQVGYIFVSKADVRKRYGVKRVSKKIAREVRKALEKEVEIYSSWANGEVYGFVVEDENGEHLDSCWGFIGAPEYCLEQGMNAVAEHIEGA